MKKILLGCAALLMVACGQSLDYTPPVEEPSSGDGASTMLGITVDPAHTWNMTQQRTLKVTGLPAGFDTKVVMVLGENPFATDGADILGYTEEVGATLSYEAPSYCTKLYAACVNGSQMRVRAFDVNEGTVDFSKDALQFSSKTAAPARRAARALSFQPSVNAQLFADQGWQDEIAQVDPGTETVSFTNFSDYAAMFQGFLPENQRNNRKLASFNDILHCYRAIVAEEDGEVTIIPVHKESIISQCIGYYYYLPGETHDIKKVKKYVFPSISKIDDTKDEVTQQVFRLQYFDAEGNASYQFPKGTEIYFFLHVDQTTYNGGLRDLIGSKTHIDWYAEETANVAISDVLYGLGNGTYNAEDGWREFSHVVMFERNNELFVGMEDWVIDFDYNDIIFMIRGDVESLPSSETEVPSTTRVYTYAFEDTHNGDYDLNDVVLQVKRIYGGNNQEVRLAAVGGWDRLYAYYKDEQGTVKRLFGGKELHELMGVPQESFVNTENMNVEYAQLPTDKIQFDYKTFLYSKADFYIYNDTKKVEIHIPTAIGAVGSNPYGVCVPYAWAWPKEKTSVLNAYSNFRGFAENQQVNTDWYTTPVEGKIFK